MSDLTELTARELIAAFGARDTSPVEVLDAVAEQVESIDVALA